MKVVLTLAITLLLTLALLSGRESSSRRLSQRKSWPVEKLPNRSPTVADIQFTNFEFERLAISRHGPTPAQISGPPSQATKYFVQPRVQGQEAIATAKFEAIDEHGTLIAAIPMLLGKSPVGDPYFFGLMLVPDRPFRVVVSGQGVDGSAYKRTYNSLFVPTSEPQKPNAGIPLGEKSEKEKRLIALLEDLQQQEYLKIEQEFAKLQDGTIVMPRTRVFDVNYAPLFSQSGQPLGLRITYEMEFSQDGYYNPDLKVYPDFENLEWRGKVEMKVLNASINPQPTAESPQEERSHPLEYGAGYIYRANTTYHFSAELVPDYVIQKEKTKFCLYNQKFHYDPRAGSVLKAILASKAPVTYRVTVQNSDFEGIIEKFYSHHELYNSFVAEGAVDCEPQPTPRFY